MFFGSLKAEAGMGEVKLVDHPVEIDVQAMHYLPSTEKFRFVRIEVALAQVKKNLFQIAEWLDRNWPLWFNSSIVITKNGALTRPKSFEPNTMAGDRLKEETLLKERFWINEPIRDACPVIISTNDSNSLHYFVTLFDALTFLTELTGREITIELSRGAPEKRQRIIIKNVDGKYKTTFV